MTDAEKARLVARELKAPMSGVGGIAPVGGDEVKKDLGKRGRGGLMAAVMREGAKVKG